LVSPDKKPITEHTSPLEKLPHHYNGTETQMGQLKPKHIQTNPSKKEILIMFSNSNQPKWGNKNPTTE
jgi:hypothetical protein